MARDDATPGEFTTALAAHTAAYEAFQSAAWSLPIAWRDTPGACGTWTAREVVCHSTGWEAEALRRLRAIAADPTTPARTYDDDQFNAAQVAARQGLGWVAALADLAVTHAALRAFLGTIAPADAARDRRFGEWLLGRASDFEDHAAQLRAWR